MQEKKTNIIEKIRFLRSKSADQEVVEYLTNILKKLYIKVLDEYKGYLFDLMLSNKLEGWCWQTTESAIVFLKDEDYIERGTLYFDEEIPEYYHSWICFKYNDEEYVLDPCLDFLCEKKSYIAVFDAKVMGKVSAKEVREELIRQVTKPKEEITTNSKQMGANFIKSLLGDRYEEFRNKNKGEVIVNGPEDVNTPLYRNRAGYKIEIENEKIKKLTVHYYRNG